MQMSASRAGAARARQASAPSTAAQRRPWCSRRYLADAVPAASKRTCVLGAQWLLQHTLMPHLKVVTDASAQMRSDEERSPLRTACGQCSVPATCRVRTDGMTHSARQDAERNGRCRVPADAHEVAASYCSRKARFRPARVFAVCGETRAPGNRLRCGRCIA
jgi:hypothetical protein